MTQAAAIVLALLIAGEAIAARFALPFPGSALGLVTLAAIFAWRGGPDAASARLFDFAAPYFPLFFVPAAVGVIVKLDVLAVAWLHVLAAVVLGTAITLAVTGLVFQALLRRLPNGVDA
jgi:holin-like protein